MTSLKSYFKSWTVWILYRTLSRTWRFTLVEPPELVPYIDKGCGAIFAHWHGDELVLLPLIRRYTIATMTSTSKDGEIMDMVIRRFGGATSRGSSTRGAVSALKGLVRLTRKDHNASMAVDGPKGPIYQVKPGVFELSRLGSLSIFAGGVSCDRAFHFPRSWNKTFLPKPFAKVAVVWRLARTPISKEDDPRSEELLRALKDQLDSAKQHASKIIAPCKGGC